MINTLELFQKEFPNGFDSISLDISGFCNAKCKFCPAGNDLKNKGKFMSLSKYESILNKLLEYRLCTKNTNFHIYGLGEPCLHPQLNEILKITNNYGMRTTISTNASIIPKLDKEGLKCVDRILISMSGFSQKSYDRIHGFDFEKIKSNIVKLKEMVDSLAEDNLIPFDMSYHMYQFNGHEINKALEFCMENKIRFSPNYAVLIDKNKCMSYVNNTMSYDELKDISKELYLGVLDHQIEVSPRNYCDFQERFLSINADGDIRICSGFTADYEENILCGNILTDNIDEILEKKYKHPRCKICIQSGLTLGKGYDCKVFPDFWYSLFKENEYLKKNLTLKDNNNSNIENNIRILHVIRNWEEEHYAANEGKRVIEMIRSLEIEKNELDNIILEYSRFGSKTLSKVNQLINL